ncbi:MAG: glycosyltransferase [Methanosphaera stadtmanae]|nr:glycosyltransferase [Methanosphaera stadtmanae]
MYKISIVILIDSFNNVENIIEILKKQNLGFENIELIFIDNYSDDDTQNYLSKLSMEYPNIIKYRTRQKLAKNNLYNIGIKLANAKYVMFANNNFSYLNYSFETLYNVISNEDVNIVWGNYILNYENKFIQNNVNIPFKNGLLIVRDINKEPDLLKNSFLLETFIFNRNFLMKKLIEFDENISDNTIFIQKSLLNSEKTIFINKPILKIKENIINEKINNSTYIQYINSYLKFIDYLNEKFPQFIWLSSKIVKDMIDLLLTYKFNDVELYYILEQTHKLFIQIDTSAEHMNLTFKENTLFNLIVERKYDKLVKILNLVHMDSRILDEKIKSKDILILFYGFDYEIGGLAKAVFNRANMLTEYGYSIKLINIDPYSPNFMRNQIKNIKLIENNFRKLNYIHSEVEFLNVFEYYRDKNTLSNITFKDIDFSSDLMLTNEYVIKKISQEKGVINYNYYRKEVFTDKELKRIYFESKKEYSNDIKSIVLEKIFDKNIYKTEYYINKELYLISYYNNLNKIIKEEFYTNDGFIYFEIIKYGNKNKYEYILHNIETKSQIIFNNLKRFWDYFIEEICMECNEKPFLINDCSGPIPSINNVSADLAYKIGNIHSNPYLKPTYCYGSPLRNIAALKDIENMDTIITLTNSEKNDFIKEFKSDKFYTIPNLINLDEIFQLDKINFKINKKKISIFSRISKEKNLEDAIKAFNIVVKKHPDAILNIYGRYLKVNEQKEYKKLQALVNKLGLEQNVFFKGHITNSYEEMRTSLFTLLVSHIEGLPMVLIESMANKTPMITYDINYGPNDVISNNIDGIIVEKYNVDELADKMIYLLDNPNKAMEMGILAQQKIIKEFSSEKICKKWTHAFRNTYLMAKTKLIEQKLTIDMYESNIKKLSNINSSQYHRINDMDEIIDVNRNKINQIQVDLIEKKNYTIKQKKLIYNNEKKIEEDTVNLEKLKKELKKLEVKHDNLNDTIYNNQNEINQLLKKIEDQSILNKKNEEIINQKKQKIKEMDIYNLYNLK